MHLGVYLLLVQSNISQRQSPCMRRHSFLRYATFVQLYHSQRIIDCSLNVLFEVSRLESNFIQRGCLGDFAVLDALLPDLMLGIQ